VSIEDVEVNVYQRMHQTGAAQRREYPHLLYVSYVSIRAKERREYPHLLSYTTLSPHAL
jgi:hypothetical protein